MFLDVLLCFLFRRSGLLYTGMYLFPTLVGINILKNSVPCQAENKDKWTCWGTCYIFSTSYFTKQMTNLWSGMSLQQPIFKNLLLLTWRPARNCEGRPISLGISFIFLCILEKYPHVPGLGLLFTSYTNSDVGNFHYNTGSQQNRLPPSPGDDGEPLWGFSTRIVRQPNYSTWEGRK